MDYYYTVEKNAQIVISLLKQSGIKKVIVSPGTSNIPLVASLQCDKFFEIYSCVDERSAAYMACGLAAESLEPVVLTCTGATASRNYLPGLTEAFYRKLPVIAITSSQAEVFIGSYSPQAIDRSQVQNDIAVFHTYLRTVRSEEEYRLVNIRMNKAIHSLFRRGGGPVHIDLETHSSRDFSVKKLPVARKINYYDTESELPGIIAERVIVFVGNHTIWKKEDVDMVDKFCAQYNGIVVCDHSSKYYGKYAVHVSIFGQGYMPHGLWADLCIHIGTVTADDHGLMFAGKAAKEWRVNKDGEIRDVMRNTDSVFEMSEQFFFKHYVTEDGNATEYLDACKEGYNVAMSKIPELPFSNPWIARELSSKLPINSILHTGILNSTRSWNMFEIDNSIQSFCNSGGFGIDGIMSAAIGASFANPKKLHFCIIGDLAFFYDMNCLGNRHIGNNLRILLVNNGCGTEFKNFNNLGAKFEDEGSKYIAAMGHYGCKSRELVRHFAKDLEFIYLTASNKEEFLEVSNEFINPKLDKSIVFEVFTNWQDESNALELIYNTKSLKDRMRRKITNNLGHQKIELIKRIIGK